MIYFDNAATTYPKPEAVYSALNDYVRNRSGNPGRGSHALSLEAARSVYKARDSIAVLFHADAENVVFTMNTTYALNIALMSVVERGDHILVSDMEHNSVMRPVVDAVARIPDVSYDIFHADENADKALKSIDRKRRGSTRILISAHMSNIIPNTLPLLEVGKYCREHNIIFIADCAQSAGKADIDIIRDNVDVICAPGHKGLYGIQGCGIMIFGDTDKERFQSVMSGGSGTSSIPKTMPGYTPDKFEAGTLPAPAIASLYAGIGWINKIGIDKIAKREYELCEYIIKELRDNKRVIIYNKHPGGTLLFNIEGKSPSEVSSFLSKRGICVRGGLHCAPSAHKTIGTFPDGAVRASFGAFNSKKEADAFIDAVDHFSNN